MMWLGFAMAYLGCGWNVCRRDRVAILEASTQWEYTTLPLPGEVYTAENLRARQVGVVDRTLITMEIVTRLFIWPILLSARLGAVVWRRWVDRIVRKWTS